LTVEAYLQGELLSEVRYEYVNSEVFAVVGTSVAHNIIALNVASALRDHLRDGPCQVFVSDVKVHIKEADNDRADKFYAYRRIPTLSEYVLVAQDVQRVEIYRRKTGWDLELYGEGDRFRLDSVDTELSVAEVYESVEMGEGSAGSGALRG
jgi:Uma2 family endonuclease